MQRSDSVQTPPFEVLVQSTDSWYIHGLYVISMQEDLSPVMHNTYGFRAEQTADSDVLSGPVC